MIRKCKSCPQRFTTGDKRRKFCSTTCYHRYQSKHRNVGCFTTGTPAWNRGRNGLHLSPATEFKKGVRGVTWLPVGTVTIRHRRREPLPRAWVKVADPNKWRPRAVVEWEKARGPVPRGQVVHHKNRDTLDDSLSNLELQSRRNHCREHADELYAARRKRR